MHCARMAVRGGVRVAARVGTSSVVVGLGLAVCGLLTLYVDAMRQRMPLRIAGWFDVKAQLGNVFYAAARNAGELLPNLIHGQWSAAMANLTNMAGIRSNVYTQVMHAGATNNAEVFTLWAPPSLLLLTLLGLALRRRLGGSLLAYLARIGIVSAACTSVLLNAVLYYQGLAGGIAGWIGYVGSGAAKAIDFVVKVGAGAVKEVAWHLFFLLTDGKEKTLGWLTSSQPVEDLSHYLAHFPAAKMNPALHGAVFQALVAAGLLWLAHQRQTRALRAVETPRRPAASKRRWAPKHRRLTRTRRPRRPVGRKRSGK